MRLDKKLIIVVLCLLIIIPIARAVPIGISPAEKTVMLTENKPGVIFFAVSQGGDKPIAFAMSTNVDWLEFDPETFELEAMGQKFVQAKISPLPLGNHSAIIKASTTPIPGMVAIRQFITATLYVSVFPPEIPPETKEMLKNQAQDAIERARDMINEARMVGADTKDAEALLTKAMEELASENYIQSMEYADRAYNLALSLYNEAIEKARVPLIPIQTGLLIIILGASVVIILILYELYRVLKRKKARRLPIVKGVKCPACGKDMAVAYKGALVVGYVCPKCKHTEIKEKLVG